jgi:predicted nucleic acid-binding protein
MYLDPADGQTFPRTQIEIEELEATDSLTVVDLTDEELPKFVEYSASLDDGEASTLAACVHRAASLATDDRAALRFVAGQCISVPVIQTAGLIRRWADASGISTVEIATALRCVRYAAHFMPSSTDPDRRWWETFSPE